MKVTLYLQVNGRIKNKYEVKYELKEVFARMLYHMYAGKDVTVFYVLESKMNYEPERKEDTHSGGNDRKEISPAAPVSKY